MTTVLVVDDMAAFREPIAASLRLAGYETICATDGEDALEWTRRRRPDLILLDVAMPKMDGLTFLRHLRAEAGIANTKVILLTAHSEKTHVMTAATLGVRDYLLKSQFRLKDLEERIKRLEQPGCVPATPSARPAVPIYQSNAVPNKVVIDDTGLPPLISRKMFQERIKRVCETRALSGSVTQVISLASSSEGGMLQLADLIARDPILSARVLQAANAATYTSRGPAVTNIQNAIRKLGFSTIKNIAASISVFDCMPQSDNNGLATIRCWQHSFAVAQICEQLAKIASPELSGSAYLVGLCHDLADIFIRLEFGKEYQALTELARDTGQPIETLQREVFGMNAGEICSAVLTTLAIPEPIRRPIEAFLCAKSILPSESLVRILQMAEYYANSAQLSASPEAMISPFTQSFCLSAIGHKNPPKLDPQLLRSEVQAITVSLSQLSRTDQGELMKPDFQRRSAKVWLARDAAISAFDPLEVALGNMAETIVSARLPAVDEVAQIDGLVTVTAKDETAGFTAADHAAITNLTCRSGRSLSVLSFSNLDGKTPRTGPNPNGRGNISLASLAGFISSLQ